MVTKFDLCSACPMKKHNENGKCLLPACLYDAYGVMPGPAVVETIVLWEQGMTIEQIAKARNTKVKQNTYSRVANWRAKLKQMGLLV